MVKTWMLNIDDVANKEFIFKNDNNKKKNPQRLMFCKWSRGILQANHWYNPPHCYKPAEITANPNGK